MSTLSRETATTLSADEIIGSTHVAGLYNFSDTDHLNEGGRCLEELGTKVARVWDSNNQSQTSYRFNQDWPDRFDSVTAVLTDPKMARFLNRSFETVVLTTYARSTPGIQDHYWRAGLTDQQYEATVREYREATEHLLQRYDGTGKTFVFQNWEGDWAILDTIDQNPPEPSSDTVDNMIQWLSARQEGVERGRNAVQSDASVFHAASVNRVRSAMEGERRVINTVVPDVSPPLDFVAYSSWDLLVDLTDIEDDDIATTEIENTLSYIHDHTPEPTPAVDAVLPGDRKNVYVGEYGWDLTADPQTGMRLIRLMTETAIEWGARWLLFWQLYSNEYEGDERPDQPTDDDVKGFYLIKPDGSPSAAWEYFETCFDS